MPRQAIESPKLNAVSSILTGGVVCFKIYFMVPIAQLARVQDCESWGCGFEPRWAPLENR